jgi:hypothetical protein
VTEPIPAWTLIWERRRLIDVLHAQQIARALSAVPPRMRDVLGPASVVVAQQQIGRWFVSTIWSRALAHAELDPFETMAQSGTDQRFARWPDLARAREGHSMVCHVMRLGPAPGPMRLVQP